MPAYGLPCQDGRLLLAELGPFANGSNPSEDHFARDPGLRPTQHRARVFLQESLTSFCLLR